MNKRSLMLATVYLMIFSMGIFTVNNFFMTRHPNIAWAEDDDEHEDEDDDDDDERESSSSKSSTKEVTETIVVTPEQIIYEQQTRDISVPDTDRDGLADEDDPHPGVAEIYVVSDKDGNGISDEYERFFEKITIRE